MAVTFFDENDEYLLNYFRVKPFNEGYLLTTDHGSWIFLTKQEYRSLINGHISNNVELFSLLREKGFIIASDNIEKIIRFYNQRYGFLFNGVSIHTLFMLDNSTLMNQTTAQQIVNFIFQSPAVNLTIEFINNSLSDFDIVSYIVNCTKKLAVQSNKHVNFKLVSNLSGMNDSVFNFLIKERFRITTFLDGSKEIHEKNNEYTNGNSYDAVISWIGEITRKYRIDVVPKITRYSLKNSKEIIEEYLQHNRDYISLAPLSISSFNDQWNQIGYSALEFFQFWKSAIDYIININASTQFREEFTLTFLRKLIRKEGIYSKHFSVPFGSVLTNLVYLPDGSIYPNEEAIKYEIFKLGNVTNKYPEVVLSSQSIALMRTSMNDSPLIDSDTYKPFIGVCSICSYAENKNIIPKFPNFNYTIQTKILDYLFEKILFNEDYRKVFLNWV